MHNQLNIHFHSITRYLSGQNQNQPPITTSKRATDLIDTVN